MGDIKWNYNIQTESLRLLYKIFVNSYFELYSNKLDSGISGKAIWNLYETTFYKPEMVMNAQKYEHYFERQWWIGQAGIERGNGSFRVQI